MKPAGRLLTTLGVLTASPWAFAIFVGYVAGWALFERSTLNWHGVATLATWLMTLCIQRAEHRDTQAIHAKLDALIRANPEAADVTTIDRAEPEQIEEHREEAEWRREGDSNPR